MRQLTGLPCVRCEKEIPSILSGQFCQECGCPVHLKCMQPDPQRADACALCGASMEAAKANLQVEKHEATELERGTRVNRGLYHIGSGFALVAIGMPLSLMCMGGLVSIAFLVIGVAQMGVGIVIMMRKGPPQY